MFTQICNIVYHGHDLLSMKHMCLVNHNVQLRFFVFFFCFKHIIYLYKIILITQPTWVVNLNELVWNTAIKEHLTSGQQQACPAVEDNTESKKMVFVMQGGSKNVLFCYDGYKMWITYTLSLKILHHSKTSCKMPWIMKPCVCAHLIMLFCISILP